MSPGCPRAAFVGLQPDSGIPTPEVWKDLAHNARYWFFCESRSRIAVQCEGVLTLNREAKCVEICLHSVFGGESGCAVNCSAMTSTSSSLYGCLGAGCSRRTRTNGDQPIGHSRGGSTTKIHALVDGVGMLARVRPRGARLAVAAKHCLCSTNSRPTIPTPSCNILNRSGFLPLFSVGESS